jgi:uncharacterized membrane protein
MDPAIIDVLLRWIHLLAGIVWIGHNYAGVVLVPRFVPYSPAQEPTGVVTSSYMGRVSREHGMFRYTSLVAIATGLLMLANSNRLVSALMLDGIDAPIGLAVWIGIFMAANLWFVMWPHQKKVLGFVEAPDAERVRCSRITFLSARVNTTLSLPLLFFMETGAHAPYIFAG